MSSGPFYAFARGSVALAKFNSARSYIGTDSTGAGFQLPATASWNGRLYSGMAGMSYQLDVNDRVAVKPMAIIDYYRLHEKGYTETGSAQADGSDAMDLSVAGRTSETYSATTTVTGI